MASISRPTMNFCRLPPDRLLAAAPGPPALTLKRSISAAASASHRRRVQIQPRAADALGAREQRVLRQRQRGHRAAAEPLLGHEVQARACAGARRVRATMSLPNSADRCRLARAGPRPTARPSAPAGRCPTRRRRRRSRRRAPRSAMSCRSVPNWSCLASVRPCTCSTTAPALCRAVLQLRRLGADHQARQAGVALLRRIDLAGDLAAAQHGAVVAQRADLVELVADVEDRAALGRQLAQRDEQLLHRLRRQHRGRLVEDQQLRVWSAARARSRRAGARPPTACAPAARGRRRGRSRAATLAMRRVTSGSVKRLVQAEPDVLGRGQRVEQREVLEHHADAQRARLAAGCAICHRAGRSSGSRPRRAAPRRR